MITRVPASVTGAKPEAADPAVRTPDTEEEAAPPVLIAEPELDRPQPLCSSADENRHATARIRCGYRDAVGMNPNKGKPGALAGRTVTERDASQWAERFITHTQQLRRAIASTTFQSMHTPKSAANERYFSPMTARRERARALGSTVVTLMLMIAPFASARAQGGGGGGQGSPTTPPAASIGIKRNADRDDPLNFLLERKKLLQIDKSLEDSLKYYRKEMQHMQDVVFKDLDKAAAKKELGQLPSATKIASMTKEAEDRVKDIQSAYRDRARILLSERQRTQVDSIDNVWKRTNTPPPA